MSSSAAHQRLSIGQFSRASLLSVKALRTYHERGLLVPAVVDRATSYRYFSVAQLSDAAIIRRLRDLDVSLDDIETVLNARNPEVTKKVLAMHHDLMAERLAQTARIVGDLQRGLDEPGVLTPVRVVDVPAIDVLTLSAEVSRLAYAAFFDESFGALLGALEASDALSIVAGPTGATYPGVIDIDETEPVVAYVPIHDVERATTVVRDHFSDRPSVRLERWAACRMATATFRGSYDDLGSAYRLLGTWAAEHGPVDDGRVREIYLVGPEIGPDASQYITELQWPLRDPLSTLR